MTHFYEVPRDRKEDGGFQGLQEEGGESLTHGDTVSVWGDGKDLWMVVIVHNHVNFIYFLLEYDCFSMCQLLLCNRVNQPYV